LGKFYIFENVKIQKRPFRHIHKSVNCDHHLLKADLGFENCGALEIPFRERNEASVTRAAGYHSPEIKCVDTGVIVAEGKLSWVGIGLHSSKEGSIIIREPLA
jgi:hypothetical protein